MKYYVTKYDGTRQEVNPNVHGYFLGGYQNPADAGKLYACHLDGGTVLSEVIDENGNGICRPEYVGRDVKDTPCLFPVKDTRPELRAARVTYDTGEVINANMAAHLTDQEITDYFTPGRAFNLGHGLRDRMARVVRCEIMK